MWSVSDRMFVHDHVENIVCFFLKVIFQTGATIEHLITFLMWGDLNCIAGFLHCLSHRTKLDSFIQMVISTFEFLALFDY